MEIDKDKIKALLDESSAKVENIMKDTAALENILQTAETKLNEIPNIGQYASKLPSFAESHRFDGRCSGIYAQGQGSDL